MTASDKPTPPEFDNLDCDQWKRTFDTNIYGYFHMAKAAVDHMGKGGGTSAA